MSSQPALTHALQGELQPKTPVLIQWQLSRGAWSSDPAVILAPEAAKCLGYSVLINSPTEMCPYIWLQQPPSFWSPLPPLSPDPVVIQVLGLCAFLHSIETKASSLCGWERVSEVRFRTEMLLLLHSAWNARLPCRAAESFLAENKQPQPNSVDPNLRYLLFVPSLSCCGASSLYNKSWPWPPEHHICHYVL